MDPRSFRQTGWIFLLNQDFQNQLLRSLLTVNTLPCSFFLFEKIKKIIFLISSNFHLLRIHFHFKNSHSRKWGTSSFEFNEEITHSLSEYSKLRVMRTDLPSIERSSI